MNNPSRTTRSRHVGGAVLILLCLLAAGGCAQTIDVTSADVSRAIAGNYRAEAMVLKEKSVAIAESAVRYEHLFGSQSDWVSGAKQLSQYYAVAAQDLERRAETYEEAARTGQPRRR